VVDDKTVGLRFAANTLAIIAAVSCLLSSVGLYSLMSFLMSRRTREIGVRVALGATRWDIVRLTGTTAVKLTAAGIIVGLVLAYAAGRLMEQAMFGVVNPSLTLAIGLAVLLALVSMAASYIPAQRAAMVDPTTALRAE
jgi:putative ABC transport system permease protein